MMPYTDYTVRLGDLKRAIMKNPYDPNLNIDGYMRYLKYNTPSAQPEILACGEGELNVADTNVGDMINRQAAVCTIEEYADRLQMVDWNKNPGVMYKAHALNWCINTIRDLPSAERKKGEWIDMNTLTTMYMPRYKCSICDEWANKSNYCPNCGADMRGERK